MSNRIACPLCGAETSVLETRAHSGGMRRRRRCTKVTCAGRLTTLEVPINPAMSRGSSRLVLVSMAKLDALIDFVAQMRPKDDPWP